MGRIPDLLRRRHGRAAAVLLSILLLAALVMSLWEHLERHFVFFPTPEIEYTPDQVGLAYEDIRFSNQDGRQLHGWYIEGKGPITLLWFHGNGGNISHRVDEMALLHRWLGVNVFIFDYQGYGRSEGQPSEQATYRDARAALEYLRSRPDINRNGIVYFGRSLGAAVAVELAVAHPPLGLVLVGSFTSLADMARVHYPLLPARLLVRGRYDSLARIARVDRPVIIFHGDHDTTVPLSQGQKLFDLAGDPKELHILAGAGHNDTYVKGGNAYWDPLARFLAGLSPGTPGGKLE